MTSFWNPWKAPYGNPGVYFSCCTGGWTPKKGVTFIILKDSFVSVSIKMSHFTGSYPFDLYRLETKSEVQSLCICSILQSSTVQNSAGGCWFLCILVVTGKLRLFAIWSGEAFTAFCLPRLLSYVCRRKAPRVVIIRVDLVGQCCNVFRGWNHLRFLGSDNTLVSGTIRISCDLLEGSNMPWDDKDQLGSKIDMLQPCLDQPISYIPRKPR